MYLHTMIMHANPYCLPPTSRFEDAIQTGTTLLILAIKSAEDEG
jgi:hypothetical protein